MARRPVPSVCFPYAGGNAVNFQPMARALRDSGLAVYAVELPGHDVGATSEPFAPLAQVVDRVVAEIDRRGLTSSPAVGTLCRRRARRRDGPAAAAGRDDRAASVPRRAAARCRGGPARRRHRARRTQQRGDRRAAERGQRLHRARRAGRANEPSMSVLRTGTTACRRTAISPMSWTTRRRNGCPRRSLWSSLRTTRPRRGSGHRYRDWELSGRTRRAARARRRRSLLPAHPSGRGGAGRSALRRNVGFFMTANELKGAEMSSSPPASLLDVELQSWQASDPAGRGHRRRARAGQPSTGTRCAPSWQSTVRFWSVASGCATPPRPPQSSSGWPPA